MEILAQLTVLFRSESLVEMKLAIHSATFVMLKDKGFIWGFKEVFDGQCFVLEMAAFLQKHRPREFKEWLSQVGITEPEFTEAVEEFNKHVGRSVQVGTVSIVHNRMATKVSEQQKLF